jgi:transposase
MPRRRKDPLRPLTADERRELTRLSRSRTDRATRVARAAMLLAVAGGSDYQQAARAAGRKSGDAVCHLVARFNREGLVALDPRHGGGRTPTYGATAQGRILREVARTPTPEADGTAAWSLAILRRVLRAAPDGLPKVSTFTIWRVLRDAGYTFQRTRTWCPTGVAVRRRKAGVVTVTDHDAAAKKKLIEDAFATGPSLGLEVWCEDEAGPFQAVPHPGASWQPQGHPARRPHEYVRGGTAKVLTLFRPADGRVRVEGTTNCPNTVAHPWLKRELLAILAELPAPPPTADPSRASWVRWQAGLTMPITLPEDLPPLRVLLVLDNLAGHRTPELVLWLFAHGVMPLFTPLGGSWLNMAESIQRVLKRRALAGEHPANPAEISPAEISARFGSVARHWNEAPTPFVWGGERAARRKRQRERRHTVGGSGAFTRQPIRGSRLWPRARQMTH